VSELLVGRDESCEIVIPDRQVSRQHARISATQDGIILEDLGSKNGTHLNGELISQPTILTDGDVIQVALAQQFTFLSSDATVPLDSHPPSPKIQSASGRLLEIDQKSRRVLVNQKEILPPLSHSQYQLLELLYVYDGKVVPRSEIIMAIWGDEQAVEFSEQALDALVRRLRDRIATSDLKHNFIVTIRGHGLRLDNPPG
jgi:hypothetical protein